MTLFFKGPLSGSAPRLVMRFVSGWRRAGLVVGFSLGAATLASFAAQPTPPAPPAAPAAPAPVAPAPATAPAPAGALGVAKVGDHFGDWIFECAAIAEGQTLCSLTQTLVAKDSNRAVARFSLSRDKKTNEISFGALIPLGLEIPAGVGVTIDQNPPIPLVLVTCVQNGCIANAALTAKQFETMKTGKSVSVSFKLRGTPQPAVLTGSLNGLGAGADAAGIK